MTLALAEDVNSDNAHIGDVVKLIVEMDVQSEGFILIKKGTTMDRIPELYFYFLGGLLSTLVVLCFLFCKIKASIHMVGISSLLFLVIGLSFHFKTNLTKF